MQDLSRYLDESDAQENDIKIFIDELRKYGAIRELNEAVLNRLIDRILIGEVRKINGEKVQEVKIIYNFVGDVSAETAIG